MGEEIAGVPMSLVMALVIGGILFLIFLSLNPQIREFGTEAILRPIYDVIFFFLAFRPPMDIT